MIKEGQEKLAGVYKIWHEEQPKYVYIGSTVVHLQRRFGKHLNELRSGIHVNTFLKNVFNKYGEHGLHCELLEESNLPAEELRELEQTYIDQFVFNNGRNLLMNGSLIAASPLDDPKVQARKVARVKEAYERPETLLMAQDRITALRSDPEIEQRRKEKLLETCSRKTKARNDAKRVINEARHQEWLKTYYGKEVICVETGETFVSPRDACEKKGLGKSESGIVGCCTGKSLTCSGFRWQFADESIRVPQKQPVDKTIKVTSKPVVCTTNGMEFKSVNEAVRWVKTFIPTANKANISSACEFANSTAYGFMWEYAVGPKEQDKPKRPSQAKLTPEERRLAQNAGRDKTRELMKDPVVARQYVERMLAATRIPVRCLDNGMVFESVSDAGRWVKANTKFNGSSAKICLVCKGKRPTAYGYRWEYLTI